MLGAAYAAGRHLSIQASRVFVEQMCRRKALQVLLVRPTSGKTGSEGKEMITAVRRSVWRGLLCWYSRLSDQGLVSRWLKFHDRILSSRFDAELRARHRCRRG